MNIRGRVENGVVVLEDNVEIPEGTSVMVFVAQDAPDTNRPRKRLEFPLVHSKNPGKLNLTNERIAEIFEEEEIEKFRRDNGDVSA